MNHEVISKIIITVLTSFVFVLIVVPFIKNIAIQINAVDNNMGGRHIHKKPVPKLGGIAIFLGFLFNMVDSGLICSLISLFAITISAYLIIRIFLIKNTIKDGY